MARGIENAAAGNTYFGLHRLEFDAFDAVQYDGLGWFAVSEAIAAAESEPDCLTYVRLQDRVSAVTFPENVDLDIAAREQSGVWIRSDHLSGSDGSRVIT